MIDFGRIEIKMALPPLLLPSISKYVSIILPHVSYEKI